MKHLQEGAKLGEHQVPVFQSRATHIPCYYYHLLSRVSFFFWTQRHIFKQNGLVPLSFYFLRMPLEPRNIGENKGYI